MVAMSGKAPDLFSQRKLKYRNTEKIWKEESKVELRDDGDKQSYFDWFLTTV